MQIVEVSGYVATPLAGMTLSQLGADAIRVQQTGGVAYRSFADLAADARLHQDNPLLGKQPQPGVGSHPAPGSPVVMAGEQCPAPGGSPSREHTGDVLRAELGMSADELTRLQHSRVNGFLESPSDVSTASGRRRTETV